MNADLTGPEVIALRAVLLLAHDRHRDGDYDGHRKMWHDDNCLNCECGWFAWMP